MKTFLVGLGAAFVILPLGVLGYFGLGLAPVQSDVNPPAWESHQAEIYHSPHSYRYLADTGSQCIATDDPRLKPN